MSIQFAIFLITVVLMIVTGFYCMTVTRNLIRILVGLEILIKGVTLLLIAVGHASSKLAFTESFVITLIVIEVVIMTVAAGIIIGIFKNIESLNVNNLVDRKEDGDE
jgi:NADH-quinone oxidoreductase subunit K